jgi:putative ABC transport system ATP-binding protein
MSKLIVEAQALSKQFRLGEQTINAVDQVSFTITAGEMVSIVGPSGSGKSTLLGLIGGLDTPTSGRIAIDGVDISRMKEKALTRIRNEKIGFVFQFFNLIPTLTAQENVALPVHFATKRQFNPDERAQALLSQFGLAGRLRHRPHQLSGGEQQRVAIARALANNPPLLLTDEPTGNLNTEAGDLVLAALRRAREEFGTTVIIVTHDLDIAAQTDRMLHLIDGRIVDGEPAGGQPVAQHPPAAVTEGG